ncbi:MAG TPA: hypothetical protein VK879_10185 [Candidatus Sulfomarinibacteraceae bacterium]|nr:hypothetical protein [Candidatus Sulfomarinibacteraceae bacterium]
MRVEPGIMVALGYGKYFRSDSIVGLEPIEEERGPGRRTRVFVEGRSEPVIASRSESIILRDMVESPRDVTRAGEQYELLVDILESIQDIDPMLRTIIAQQGRWDLDRLERRIRDTLSDSEA